MIWWILGGLGLWAAASASDGPGETPPPRREHEPDAHGDGQPTEAEIEAAVEAFLASTHTADEARRLAAELRGLGYEEAADAMEAHAADLERTPPARTPQTPPTIEAELASIADPELHATLEGAIAPLQIAETATVAQLEAAATLLEQAAAQAGQWPLIAARIRERAGEARAAAERLRAGTPPRTAPPRAGVTPGDAAQARRLAPRVRHDLATRGRQRYDRALLTQFQSAAGIPADGLYGGVTRGALIYYGETSAPRPYVAPLETVPYVLAADA